jgi:SAM-dependent methyltransferase
MSTPIDVPIELRRSGFRKKPLEQRIESAIAMLDEVRAQLGIGGFEDTRFLDIGCGDRFAVALANRGIPIRAYHGVDVSADLIAHLDAAIGAPPFSFAHIDVYTEMYNRRGAPLSRATDIGADGRLFDIIGLFSVFTHLVPADWQAMLGLARRHVAHAGHLVFSAFIYDDQPEDFIDFIPQKPLRRCHYSRNALHRYVAAAGWRIDKEYKPAIQRDKEWILCSPN